MNDLAIIPAQDVGELRDIPGYEGMYAVTRDGRVWAHPREWRSGEGLRNTRRRPGIWMKHKVHSNGYALVGFRKGGVWRGVLVHRAVALAWIENPMGLPQINHINGNKTDNRDVNLEWCTGSSNKKHAFALGLAKVTPAMIAAAKAVRRRQRKLTLRQADEVRSALSAGQTQAAVARRFGVSVHCVRGIRNGISYAD